MTIKYHIEDGYVGGNRPHYIKIDANDLAACETVEEQEELIEEAIQEDFNQRVSTYWDRNQLSKSPAPNSLEDEEEDEE